MARKAKKDGGTKKGLIAWLLMLITGSGAGAGVWQFRDQAVQVLKALGLPINAESQLPILEALAENGDALLKRVDYGNPGRFEVTVKEVELPATAFAPGTNLDLEVRVLRYDEQGRETMVWETSTLGKRSVVVGSGALVASWANYPFRINWKPGDKLAFEVWNRRGLRPSKLFVLPVRDDEGFPFQTGSPSLARWTRSGPGEPDPVANVEFESKRLSTSDAAPTDEAPRVARDRRRGADDDAIDIR